MRRVLRLDRVAQDRARQPVGAIEVLVREADEGGIARGRVTDARRCWFCQFDYLGRSVHDDMTRQHAETFNPS